ncbi:MAG: hypothetical protein LJE96_21420 [Deltaproteobacteria bacterium]|nr:hypothetical protein [Deltaproteobacteria bacterium]
MQYLIRLEDDTAIDPAVVGHKFASLARATRSGFKVPLAFAITVNANDYYRRNKIWPQCLGNEIRDATQEIGLPEGVSVRSSSTLEDLGEKSFAGQYDTYLDVQNERDLKEKIEKCWESATSQSVLAYLHDPLNPSEEAPLMAVIIQKMVHAKAAGVVFSRNPMYPLRSEVVVEGIVGLGEKLVSGHVTPYRVFVRGNRVVKDKTVTEMDPSDNGILKDLNWLEIANLARKAETHAEGRPQDIEWAIDNNHKLWLLQSRPITTIRKADLKAPPGTWTRKIAEDLWADRLTPLLADAMMKNTSRFDLSKSARFLKMPVIQPSLSVINGFLYVNCESLKQVLTLLPQTFRISELRSLFPPGFEIDSIPSPNVGKLFSLVVRALALGITQPQGNPLLCRSLTRFNMRKLQGKLNTIDRLPHETAPQALKKTGELLGCLALLQEKNQWPYFYATVFTWVLKWVIKDLGGLTHSDFLHLLGTNTDNITTRIEHEMRGLAEAVAHDETLLDKFRNFPGQWVGTLPQPLQRKFDQFLFKYGCRSRHRTLYVKRWAEAPEEILGMMANLLGNSKNGGTPKAPALPAAALLQKLPWHLRLLVRPLLKSACGFLNLRENLRFFLDKILYRVRQSLLMVGKKSGLGEDVLFLTQYELEQVVYDRTEIEDAKRLAVDRREAFLKEIDVYAFYIDGRPIDELPSRSKIIRGIGTSPGRATGRARIVDDPTKQGIKKGDILVAKNTDPGWTPILRVVSGIVVEEGGILNHCSIVARELGIPAVVGVRQATRKIPEKTQITIDGDLGAVQLAEGASRHM